MALSELARAKQLVLHANASIDAARPEDAGAALAPFVHDDYRWQGMHPFNTLHGPAEVARAYWLPLKQAMGPLQRRPDIFIAGRNVMDEGESLWVTEMGHLMGLWERDFLGIPATGKIAFLRFAEFHRIEGDRIAETACYVDLVQLMHQAGLQPFPPQTGAAILTPGPRTHDGLLYEDHEPAEGKTTVDLISAMATDLVGQSVNSPEDHMQRFWTSDMCWFGPAGIGASAFYKGYRRGHSGPFEEGLHFVRHNGHQCRIGEGHFGGFFGYPSLTLTCKGGFMGMPGNDIEADMRIVDMYRREGDKLAENWIFIDLLHFFAMQGVDVLGRLRDLGSRI